MNKTALFGAVALSALLAPASFAGDSSPANHAEAYKQFLATLDEIQQSNALDFYPAIKLIYDTTHDTLATAAWMEKAAADKHPIALYYLADRAMMAAILAANPKQDAPKWYEMTAKAAESGYVLAVCNKSLCLFTGTGVTQDKKAAQSNLLALCKDNNNFARFKWLQLSERLQTPKDLERKEVQAEILRNNDFVINFAGKISGDSETQLKFLKDAALLQNAEACYTLAQVFANAKPKESYTFMQEASNLHNPNAMALLGTLLSAPTKEGSVQEKLGVTQDIEKGKELIELAAMMESSLANLIMGENYFYGKNGYAKDMERAYKHYHKAAALGDPKSTLALAYMTIEGLGSNESRMLGLRYCLQLIEAKIPHAVILMAYAHYKGYGVEADAKKSAEILQEAATFNLPIAYVYLAFITAKGGKGLETDAKKAQTYLNMAKLDLKDKAQELYDLMVKEGDWTMTP